MIIFEVMLNNKMIAKAGSPDLSVLAVIVNAAGKLGPESMGSKKHERDFELCLDVGGLTSRRTKNNDHLNWVKNNLNIGDEVLIRILESDSADQAIERKAADNIDEQHERAAFEWTKKKYFELRE